MTHAEVRKIYDSSSLAHFPGGAGRDQVLRLVLAISLDQETAAWCLGYAENAPVALWPSTLYRILARTADESPRVWRRCALVLDRTLHEPMRVYGDRSAAEIATVFLEGRESLTGEELAALLWCLVRRRCPSHDLIAERLGLELEAVVARRLSGGVTS